MKKLLAVVGLVMFIVAWYGSSDAMMRDKCMGKGMMGGGEHPMFERLKSLGLDEKQMDEVKAVHFKVMKETIKKKADAEVASLELKEILGHDPVDITAAETKIRQIETLKGDIRIMHIKAREEVKGKLTPDQRKKFVAMMPMMPGGMQGQVGCQCGMADKMKKCGKCGMKGKGMMGREEDEDMFSGGQPGCAAEMPAMEGHQHMHHGQ